MKAIFVPTDFSTTAENALPVAASIGSKTGCRIIIHHNVHTLTRWNALTRKEQEKHPEVIERTLLAEDRIDNILQRGIMKGLDCQELITHGISHEQILSHANEMKADLIVMGSHENLPGGKAFIDSTIQKVLRESDCPVMMVRVPQDELSWKKMLVPLSFNENMPEAFEEIHKLAKDLNSTIHLLYVNQPGKFKETRVVETQIQNFIAHYPDVTFEYGIYDTNETEKGILEYIDRIKPDYVALVTHDHRHQARYLISTTETIAYHATIPVISIPLRKHSHKEATLAH